jgi:Fis family transcriptional regulator
MSCPEISPDNNVRTLHVTEQTRTLRECVLNALDDYFAHLEGADPSGLYRMVISEVEQPLLETVMRYVEGNQTKAAELLGINRTTLRKKLQQYSLS